MLVVSLRSLVRCHVKVLESSLLILVLSGDVLQRDGFCARRCQLPLCGSSVVCMSECIPHVGIVDFCAGRARNVQLLGRARSYEHY